MDFPEKLVTLRKQRGLTQQAHADLVGVHVLHFARYEKGLSQPTLDVIRRLARALHVTADELIFDAGERGPDDDLRLQFEAIAAFSPEEKLIVRGLLDALILRHEAKRWTSLPIPATTTAAAATAIAATKQKLAKAHSSSSKSPSAPPAKPPKR
jgi:transcriptional regulator with XRE-family HTH domain